MIVTCEKHERYEEPEKSDETWETDDIESHRLKERHIDDGRQATRFRRHFHLFDISVSVLQQQPQN